jgi:uncharacterized protein (TIGR02246 family)
MRNAIIRMLVLLLSSAAWAGVAEDEAAIRDVVAGIYDGFNAHDPAAIARLCDEDLETWLTGRTGNEEVLAWIREMVPGSQSGAAREVEELGISFISSDVAIQKSRRELTGRTDTEGKPLPAQSQLFLRIFVKKDGRWLLRGFFPAPEGKED